jgi:UDP-N-acetyl-D-mannosaminuronic acid dehydrogenase
LAQKKIVVIGTGYVGLPAALMLAQAGYEVVGVDINENIVRAINERVLLISEDELKAMMDAPEVQQNLRASTKCESGDIYIIAVPTPLHHRKKIADLDCVVSAVESIAPHVRPGALVILESTVPPLTCRELIGPMLSKLTGLKVPGDVMVAHCPERILPGNIFREIVGNDRVIGGMDDASTEAAREVYASFVKGELMLTDDVTAELCKLMENTYRDVNVALSNEIAEVCETLGVDSRKAFELANRHPRVSFLMPGIGVGGHCIPIDPWFIKEVDPINSRLIEVARRVNDDRPNRIAARIRRKLAGVTAPKIVAIGATYKAGTEDTRESPAIRIVELLREDGYRVDHYDPLVPCMEYKSIAEAAQDADALCVLVAHESVIAEIDSHRAEIEASMRTPSVWFF